MKIKKMFIGFVLLVFVTLLAACEQTPIEEQKFDLDQTNVVLKVSETILIKATLEKFEEDIDWSIENPTIASISVDETGLEATIEGLAEGITSLVAKVGELEKKVTITVEAAASTLDPELFVSQRNVSLVINETRKLVTEVRLGNEVVIATISFESSKPEFVTVNQEGLLTGIAIGSSIIKVSATYNGKNLETSVTVVVLENLSFELDAQQVELYTSSTDETQKTSVQITPTIMLNGESVSNDEIVWTSDDEEVVTVVDGLIRAIGRGNATVTARYVSPTEQVIEQTVSVEVFIPVVETAVSIDVIYRTDATIDLTTLGLVAADIVEIVDQTSSLHKVLFTVVSDTQIKLNETDVIAGIRDYVIYSHTVGKAVELHLITKVIMTADDLQQFSLDAREFYGKNDPFEADGKLYYPKAGGYYVLGANIDFVGKTFNTIGVWGAGEKWYSTFDGILDGRGYTIYNFKVDGANSGIFVNLTDKAIVRNISFVDAYVGWAGSLIAIENSGLIENIYVSGVLRSGAEWSQNSLVIGRFGVTAGKLRNIVVVVDRVEGNLNGAVIGNIGSFGGEHFSNILVVGTTKEAALRGGTNYDLDTVNSFATLQDYKLSGLDITGFDELIWNLDAGFVPVFKSHAESVSNAIKVINIDKTVFSGSPSEVTLSGIAKVTYKIDPIISGITINQEGLISVDASVEIGSIFKVIVTFELTGQYSETEFEVVNKPITDLREFGSLKTIETGRQEDDATITLPSVESRVKSILSAGKKISISGNDVNGVFTINVVDFDKIILGENVELLVLTEDGNSYLVLINLYTLVIKTKADYQLFTELSKTAIKEGDPYIVDGVTYYEKSGGYFILGSDLDLTGGPSISQVIGNWHDPAGGFVGKFAGVFDGKGHTISNWTYDYETDSGVYGNLGMFVSIHNDGVVKNINFENVVQYWSRGGGVVALENNGLIENISIKGYFQHGSPFGWSHSGLLIRGLGSEGVIRNIIVYATQEYPGGLGAFVIGQVNTPLNPGQVENVILIGSTRAAAKWGEGNGESIETKLDEIDTFVTLDDFTTANLDGTYSNRFTSPYWDLSTIVPKIKTIS
jgi:hypothetical protein